MRQIHSASGKLVAAAADSPRYSDFFVGRRNPYPQASVGLRGLEMLQRLLATFLGTLALAHSKIFVVGSSSAAMECECRNWRTLDLEMDLRIRWAVVL